jgi:hypothetical protein
MEASAHKIGVDTKIIGENPESYVTTTILAPADASVLAPLAPFPVDAQEYAVVTTVSNEK